MEDENTYYEYGPKPDVPRYRFTENYIQMSDRAKVKLYSRKEDPLANAHPFIKPDMLKTSRFFKQRGESS
jgi:hypothetical protein